MGEATNTSHLEKVERGYENMDHYSVNFKKERKALSAIKFIAGKDVLRNVCAISLDKQMRLNDRNEILAALKCPGVFSPQSSHR